LAAGDSVFTADLLVVVDLILDAVSDFAAFNGFDVPLCNGLPVAFFADLSARVARVFPGAVFALTAVFAPALAEAVDLEVFLRDFLDIRLPFVAFGGSIIALLQDLSAAAESRLWLGKSDGPGVWLQGIRHVARLLVE
jgi:hypothetical protein